MYDTSRITAANTRTSTVVVAQTAPINLHKIIDLINKNDKVNKKWEMTTMMTKTKKQTLERNITRKLQKTNRIIYTM